MTLQPLPSIARDTLSSQAANLIRDAISRGTIHAGVTLRLDDLAKQFGVSRIPLRDAMRQLEKEGFVAITPYRGAKVLPISLEEASEMSQASALLHRAALEAVFPHLTPSVLDHAEALLHERARTNNPTEWRRLNSEFLQVFYAPANRPFLVSLIAYVTDQAERYRHLFLPVLERTGLPKITFLDMVAACRKKNLPAAIEAMEETHRHMFEILETALKR